MVKKLFSNSFFSYILISLSVIILYAPTLNNGFFNIDDESHISSNSYVKEISWENLKEIFNPFGQLTRRLKTYRPTQTTSFMIDYAIGGNNSFTYHISNVAIYLILCLLLYRLLAEQLNNSALWVTLIFSLHPVHTESVSWISARNDLLAGLFCLLSFFAYQRSQKKGGLLIYTISILFWVLALLSKPVVIFFPIIVIGYDICIESKHWRQVFIRWIPFLILSCLSFFLTIFIAKDTGHIHSQSLNLIERFLYAALLLQRYLITSLAPIQLSFYYDPFPDLFQIAFEIVLSITLCVLMVILGVSWWFKNKKKFFILVLFFPLILPVVQIIPFPIMQADRYLFLPVLAISVAIGLGLEILARKKNSRLGIILSIIIVCLYFSLSWQRVQLWESSISIWKDAVSKSSYPFAREQLGRAYFKEARYKKALDNFLKVTEEKPNYYGGFYWAGRSLMSLGRLNEADFFLKKSKNISPDNSHIYYQLGLIALWQENLDNAENYLQKAIAIEPQFWEAYYLLGLAYIKSDKPGQALEKLCKSLHPSSKNYDDALKVIRKVGSGTCDAE